MTDVEELAEQLGNLAITVDRLSRHRQTADTETARLKMGQAALAQEQIAISARLAAARRIPEPSAEPATVPPVEWMTVSDPGAAAEALTDLLTWVQLVWARYDPIQDCWPWHPPVVAELIACKRVWVAAHTATAPALASADWHTRFRVAAQKMIRDRLTACDGTSGHRSGNGRYEVEHLQLVEYAHWWAAGQGAPIAGDAPGLTPKTTP